MFFIILWNLTTKSFNPNQALVFHLSNDCGLVYWAESIYFDFVLTLIRLTSERPCQDGGGTAENPLSILALEQINHQNSYSRNVSRTKNENYMKVWQPKLHPSQNGSLQACNVLILPPHGLLRVKSSCTSWSLIFKRKYLLTQKATYCSHFMSHS